MTTQIAKIIVYRDDAKWGEYCSEEEADRLHDAYAAILREKYPDVEIEEIRGVAWRDYAVDCDGVTIPCPDDIEFDAIAARAGIVDSST